MAPVAMVLLGSAPARGDAGGRAPRVAAAEAHAQAAPHGSRRRRRKPSCAR